MANRELRPLGLGELLDRAVTLSTRNAGVMLAAIAVPYLPSAVLYWVMFGDRYGQSPSPTHSEWNALGIGTAVSVLVFLFARGAAARVAYERYAERPIALKTAFRTAFTRFGALLGLSVIATIGLGAVIVLLATVLTIAGGIIGLFGASPGTSRTAALVIALLLLLPPFVWYMFAYDLATVRVSLGASAWNALFAAFRATAFRRPWRSLLAALIAALLPVAIPVIVEFAAEAIPLAPLRVTLELGVVNVTSIIGEALSVAFLVVYNVDIAVRHEGYDLTVALEEAAPG